MAVIRKPGVEVIQQFQAVAPALGLPTLPNLIIGPAYQVLEKDTAGNYDGNSASYSYTNLIPGAIVDLAEPDESGQTLIEYPVRIFIEDGRIEFLASGATGISVVGSAEFSDASSTKFQGVEVGDKLIIEAGDDQGEYEVVEVYATDASKVKLNSELLTDASSVEFRIEREFSEVEVSRDTSGVAIDEVSVDLPASLQKDGYKIVDGVVKLSYRALRISYAASIKVYKSFNDIEADFGIGQVVPENPLAFAISLALQNTTTAVAGLGLGEVMLTSVVQAHQKALDVAKKAKVEGEDVYALAPLTQDPVVHQLYDVHVEQLSQPEKKKERIAILNRKLQTKTTISDEVLTSGYYNVTEARLDVGEVVVSPSPLASTFKDTSTADAFINVQVGDILRLAEGNADDGDYEITEVVSTSELTVDGVFTVGSSSVDYQILRRDGLWRDGKTFYDSNATFVSDGVAAGHYVEVVSSTGTGTLVGRYLIASVNNQNKLTLSVAQLGAPYYNVTYQINRDFTVDEQASYIAGYAASFGNRRLVMLWPDVAEIPYAGSVKDMPGYYFAPAIAAMVSGLPAHQGFTNLTLAGYIGFKNSSDLFDEDQLDVIAGGGNMILDQDVAEAPLYVRHQLTTDTSSIAFQELSITKNVDSISKLIRSTYQPYIGKYNINDALIELLYTVGSGLINTLKERSLPRIGAPLRGGSITSMVESSVEPDTIESEWDIDVPFPFNRLRLTLLV